MKIENFVVAAVLSICVFFLFFTGWAIKTAFRSSYTSPTASYTSPTTSYTSPTTSYTPPVSSSSDGLDWDAARRAGYSEADIDAAKTLHHLQQMDNSVQEDVLIYNTLKQMGYSDSDAWHGVESSR